jgi:hypothetical protein
MANDVRAMGGLSARLPVNTVGRVERIATINLSTTNTEFELPTNGGLLPSDRFLYGLILHWQGRTTNPGAGQPTGTHVEAPFSIIDSVRVSGYHRVRGASEQFINLRGADLRELNRLYQALEPPITPATLSVAASATNDIRFTLLLPFVPLGMPVRSQLGWLLDAPNYDQLKLQIRHGDALSIFTGQTTQPTFSAFGSATGNPSIEVHGIFAQAGPSRFSGFVPGRVWRYFQEETSSKMTTTATQQRLFQIPRGYLIRALLLKTGIKNSALVTSGNNVYNTRSDTILDNLKIFRGTNKVNRDYTDLFVLQANNGYGLGIRPNTGYGLIDWADHGWDGELMDTRSLVAGPTGDVDVYVESDITGAANQAALMLIEEWRQTPVTLLRR